MGQIGARDAFPSSSKYYEHVAQVTEVEYRDRSDFGSQSEYESYYDNAITDYSEVGMRKIEQTIFIVLWQKALAVVLIMPLGLWV